MGTIYYVDEINNIIIVYPHFDFFKNWVVVDHPYHGMIEAEKTELKGLVKIGRV